MKRILVVLLSTVLIFAWAFSASAYNGDVIVYITNTGECYHRQSCSYLKSSKEITLAAAVEKGYRPCSRCKPPKLGEDDVSDKAAYEAPPKSTSGTVRATPAQSKETPAPQQVTIPVETERSSAVPIITGLAGVGVGAAAVAVWKRKR